MKSKFKSLFFWAAFFFLIICLMVWGIVALIFNEILIDEYYGKLIYNICCVIGYLLIAIYGVFMVLIFANKFPEKIKKIEKFKILAVMLLLLFIEMLIAASALPDFD